MAQVIAPEGQRRQIQPRSAAPRRYRSPYASILTRVSWRQVGAILVVSFADWWCGRTMDTRQAPRAGSEAP